MRERIRTGAVLGAIFGAFAAPAAEAQVVTNSNDTGQGSLRQEVADTPAGGTVTFQGAQDPVLNSAIVIAKNLTITGNGAATTDVIGGSLDHRLFEIANGSSVRINDLRITGANGPDGTDSAVGAGGDAGDGGAILNAGTLFLTGVVMDSNDAGDGGHAATGFAGGDGASGGAVASTGALEIRNSRLEGNFAGDAADGDPGGAGGAGGAVFATGPTAIANSAITFNFAGDGGAADGADAGDGGDGGGIQLAGGAQTSIVGTTIYLNVAAPSGAGTTGDGGSGGGIHSTGETLFMTNSTLGRNDTGFGVTDNGVGAGIFTEDSADALAHVTIAHNGNVLGDIGQDTLRGGGIATANGGAATLRNTLLAGNLADAGANCDGSVTNATGNLAFPGGTGCAGFASGNPLLAALDPAANGGQTLTYALPAGSAAIDAANGCVSASGASLTTDQRGFSRPAGAACDIGAFEAAAPPPPAGGGQTTGSTPVTTPQVKKNKKCKKIRSKSKRKKCRKKQKKQTDNDQIR